MKKLLGITLGIMTALGGFVDLGQLIFTTQAGALFGYQLLWPIVLGTVAIIIYMEMCGRVAVVAKQPVFAVVRKRLGFKLGLATLIGSTLLNIITCAAEIAGIAIAVRLLTGWPQKLILVGSVLVIGGLVYILRFQWIERIFGLTGLLMIIFVVSVVKLRPNWDALGRGLLPIHTQADTPHALLYSYFALGIFSAMLMVYEVHFYSSGAIEERWKVQDLGENFMVASLGSLFGSVLTAALMVLGALLFQPHQIFPQMLSSVIVAGTFPFGHKALVLALLGTTACIGGAAVETALSSSYNVCQFFDIKWGKNRPVREVRTFTICWVAALGLALILAVSGIRPLTLVNISVMFGMVIMPLTYYPILRAAEDKQIMGKHANTRFDSAIGIVFLLFITAAAFAVIPLMIMTRSGQAQ